MSFFWWVFYVEGISCKVSWLMRTRMIFVKLMCWLIYFKNFISGKQWEAVVASNEAVVCFSTEVAVEPVFLDRLSYIVSRGWWESYYFTMLGFFFFFLKKDFFKSFMDQKLVKDCTFKRSFFKFNDNLPRKCKTTMKKSVKYTIIIHFLSCIKGTIFPSFW